MTVRQFILHMIPAIALTIGVLIAKGFMQAEATLLLTVIALVYMWTTALIYSIKWLRKHHRQQLPKTLSISPLLNVLNEPNFPIASNHCNDEQANNYDCHRKAYNSYDSQYSHSRDKSTQYLLGCTLRTGHLYKPLYKICITSLVKEVNCDCPNSESSR